MRACSLTPEARPTTGPSRHGPRDGTLRQARTPGAPPHHAPYASARLRRIEETLGVSLDDEDVVLGLHLAVRALRFRRGLTVRRAISG